MALISESEINALCVHVDIVELMASAVPPTHDATSAVPLQQNLQPVLQGGAAAPQQNLQKPVISPVVPDQPIPPSPPAVLVLLQNQAVLPVVVQLAVAAEHCAPSATVRNAVET